jgi:hypothetical protein
MAEPPALLPAHATAATRIATGIRRRLEFAVQLLVRGVAPVEDRTAQGGSTNVWIALSAKRANL